MCVCVCKCERVTPDFCVGGGLGHGACAPLVVVSPRRGAPRHARRSTEPLCRSLRPLSPPLYPPGSASCDRHSRPSSRLVRYLAGGICARDRPPARRVVENPESEPGVNPAANRKRELFLRPIAGRVWIFARFSRPPLRPTGEFATFRREAFLLSARSLRRPDSSMKLFAFEILNVVNVLSRVCSWGCESIRPRFQSPFVVCIRLKVGLFFGVILVRVRADEQNLVRIGRCAIVWFLYWLCVILY